MPSMTGATRLSAARARRGPSSRTLAGIAFALPAIVLLLALVAYPVLDAIRLSFHETDFFLGVDRFVGFHNFAAMVESRKFGEVLLTTAIWSMGSLAGQFALGLIAALAINQNVPGVGVVRSILLLPYVVPVIALALFWRWMLDGSYGILSHSLQVMGLLANDQSPLALPDGAMASVILANIWRGFPFVMIVYWAALQNIPQDQYDAAKVDGANALQEFWYVTLPNLKNATITLIILRVIWTVTYFDVVWLITRGGPAGATEHWPIWIYQEAMGFNRFGLAAALATAMGVVLMIAAVVYIRKTRLGEEDR